MAYVEHYNFHYVEDIPSDNDNYSEISRLTRDVISVQYHALGHDSIGIHNQVNRFATDAISFLKTLGVKKEKIGELLDKIYEDNESGEVDPRYAKVVNSTISIGSSLSIDLYAAAQDSMKSMIKSPEEYLNYTEITSD